MPQRRGTRTLYCYGLGRSARDHGNDARTVAVARLQEPNVHPFWIDLDASSAMPQGVLFLAVQDIHDRNAFWEFLLLVLFEPRGASRLRVPKGHRSY
jgi:hypothetical protein